MFMHYIKSPINAGAVTMVIGLAVVPLVSLITPKPDKAKIDDIFSGYDEKVVIEKRYSLEENSSDESEK